MPASIRTGLTTTARITVNDARSISFMGEEGRVYATPELVRDIEKTCRDLLLAHLDSGQDSVGTHLDISHLAATPMGAWVDIVVTISSVDGRAVGFEVDARDPIDRVCRGSHKRFIVDVAKTIERIRSKIDRISSA